MTQNAVSDLGREIQPMPTVLDNLDYAQALLVVFEQHALTIGVGRARETHGCQTAVLCDLARNGLLAGVAEWGVTKIMTKRNGLG